ncbi:MAG: DUF2391 family protein [Candidatus Aenigmarchaeota archaeon]|nr:DUF2391 family protein [Candidatus Aenigmarchaeota archaeon]
MPRKKKEQKQEIVKIEENIVKTPRGLFQIKALMERGGKIIATLHPLYLKEIEVRDMAQIFIGSIILAFPFMVTGEVWELGAQLPGSNIILLMLINLFTLALLLFYTRYHKVTFEGRIVFREFTKRLFVTYLMAFFTVSLFLTLLEKAPWDTAIDVAFKRVALVTLPASIGGAAVDLLK